MQQMGLQEENKQIDLIQPGCAPSVYILKV